MRSLIAFTKKEFTDQLRSGKLLLLGILFLLFGIMNPAVAKLTPWLLEIFSETMAESGMVITGVTVSAMDSWVQFYKNIPMALIAFVLIQGGIFTKEYTSGTLVLSLTKGFERYKVVLSKTFTLMLLWTLGYWICFGVTYGYNAYFWDNSVAQNLGLSALCWWIFGVWVISMIVLFSTLLNSTSGVILCGGGIAVGCYLLAIVPKIGRYLPTYLADGTSLIYGVTKPENFIAAIVITSVLSVACLVLSVPIFNKKQL
jgi:ABC-2 type transport system permease protein